MDRKPMPGDVVQVTNPKDCLIKEGSYGIIEGEEGCFAEEYMVCFNSYSIFRGTRNKNTEKPVFISASGGPALIIPAIQLKPREWNTTMWFWRWKDYPRADGGERYAWSCKVWTWEYQGR